MKIDDFLVKKAKLQQQLEDLQEELASAKVVVLEEMKKYIKEFDITFIEIEAIYKSLNLSTALIQVVTPKAKNTPDRKGYTYYNQNNGKWFNGYQAIPKWFDLAKADQYLVPGKTHTPLVKQAIAANGLDKNQIKTAYNEAQIKEFKDIAEQLEKLYTNKKMALFDSKIEKYQDNIEQIMKYVSSEVSSYVYETLEL